MIEVKTLNGYLNTDDSQWRMPPNDYIDAYNITKDAVEGSNDNVVSFIVANRLLDDSYTLHSGRNVCIGAYSNTLRNNTIYFIWNDLGYHRIIEGNLTNRICTTIFENLTDSNDVDILGFQENNKITGINIYNRDEGDLLSFLDSIGRPTYLDIEAFRIGTYTPVTRDIIDLITRPPLMPPSGVYANDTGQVVNYLTNKFFRFKTRYVYDDNRTSTTSPISEVLLPIGFLSDEINSVQTNNNVINLSIFSGAKDVKSVQILMSYVSKTNDWSDFQLVETINKEEDSIADDVIFGYSFYNDSTYPYIDINESILLYDYVPQFANAQELAVGSTLVFGAITEGYTNDLVPNVVNLVQTYEIQAGSSGNLTQTSVGLIFDGTAVGITYFSGIPAEGTIIKIEVFSVDLAMLVTGALYTTVNGDTIANVIAGLQASFATYSILANYGVPDPTSMAYQWDHNEYNYDSNVVTITIPTSSLDSNSTPVWKWSSQRNIALAYFDNKGRTNGVVYTDKVVFPPYSENGSGGINMPQITTSIYHIPPIWAYSFQFLFTKDETYFLFWGTNSVNIEEDEYIYFEVTDFIANAKKYPTTSTVLSYAFQDGDRMRLIKPIGQNVYFPSDFDAAILGLVVEPTIDGIVQTDKQFIKIKKIAPFTDAMFTPNLVNYEIEIYRTAQQTGNNENQVYYECARQYFILNPGTNERIHSGELQDQSTDYVTPATFLFQKGSTYFRNRIIALDEAGATIIINVQDLNIIDNYISAVNSIDGRPNAIDINAKQAYYSTLVRNGQPYQANTNINGLNRFYPADFFEYDYNYGDIQRFISRDRFMRVYQKLKVGSVPYFNQISRNADGTQLLVVTTKLLNPIQYYSGNYGIGDCKESLVSNNFADYFADNIKGAICRVSNDGLDVLSVLYKVNSWATQYLPLRKGDYKVWGGFDQRINNYICALQATNTDEARTISFDEGTSQDKKGFESYLNLYPECMVTLGVTLCSFKDGYIWTHDNEPYYNNFFGVQYDSSITTVFNKNELQKKTFLAITQLATRAWGCPEIITSSNEFGTTKQISELIEDDFVEQEGDYNASFLRASNSFGGLLEGSTLKGNLMSVKLRAQVDDPPNNTLATLNMVSVAYIDSGLNNR